MESPQQETNSATGIPKQIFEKFLLNLGERDISPAIVERLRRTLLERGRISEFEIKRALFSDNDVEL